MKGWRMKLLCLAVMAPILIIGGCVKQYNPAGTKDGTDSPVAPTPIVISHTIEFRVLGTNPNALVTYGSAQEGTTVITTDPPWSASFKTTRTNLFVFLTVRPQNVGRLSAQIFIDGELFREADADALPGDTLQASGTAELSATALGLVHR